MFLAAMASVERFLPRPEMVTFLGIAVFYNLLQRRSHSSIRETVALVAMQVVWANSHGLFVIGPFMVGCYPFGLNGWRYAALLFTEVGSGGPALMGTLGELSTTFGDAARSGPAFWFFLVLLVLGGIAVVVQIACRKLSPRLLIVLGLGAAALTGRRNIVLFSIAAAPFIAESLAATAIGRLHLPKVARIAAAALFLGWAIYPLSGAYYIRMEIPARWGFGVTPSFFPHELPGFLDEIEFEGQVLNSNTFGGFYGYHGFPDRIPLTDGRWEIYDKIEIVRVLEGSRHASAWRDLVDEYGISGILLAHTSPEATILLPSLRAARDWRLVYLDRAASFWLPDDGSLFPPEIKLDHGSLPDTPRFDDTLIMNSFLAGIGARELRAENLRRALEFGHRKRLILEQLGPLQIEIGHFDEAEATYQNLATENPRSAAPLNELAFLAYRRGDLQRARDLIRSAIDLEPENLEFRENLQRVEQAIQQHSGKKGDGG
jgi:hypothetical protein